MFFAVNLLKQEAHFGDEKEKEKKKNTSAIQRF